METGWRKTVLGARIRHVATTRSPSKLLANGRQYLDRFANAGGYGRHRFTVESFGFNNEKRMITDIVKA